MATEIVSMVTEKVIMVLVPLFDASMFQSKEQVGKWDGSRPRDLGDLAGGSRAVSRSRV